MSIVTWIELEGIVLSETGQRQRHTTLQVLIHI